MSFDIQSFRVGASSPVEFDLDGILVHLLRQLGPWTLAPLQGKHYGTVIRSAGDCKITVWHTGQADYPDGDAAHSERDHQEIGSHWPSGGHYESVADYDLARDLCDCLNGTAGKDIGAI